MTERERDHIYIILKGPSIYIYIFIHVKTQLIFTEVAEKFQHVKTQLIFTGGVAEKFQHVKMLPEE